MTKDVLISIEGLHFGQTDDTEAIEIITPGNYYKKNNKHYLLYEEVMEGANEPTKNTVRFTNDFLSITKRGFTNVDMVFEKNKRNMTNYVTPYGSLLVGIDADNIDIVEEDNNISISVDYALDINYEHLAECKIKMNIRSTTEETLQELGLSIN